MPNLSVQTISQTGLTPAFTAATVAGDSFINDGRAFLHVKNGGVSSITVTINSVQKCSQGFDHDLILDVAAGADKIIGPFDPKRFNDETGKVVVTYSDATSVTVAAFRM